MTKRFTEEDAELLDQLGIEDDSGPAAGRTPQEEFVVAGFEEIQRFVEEHGRVPVPGEGRDIFERIYAVRLDRLRGLTEYRSLLEPIDHQGLLAGDVAGPSVDIDVDGGMDDDRLLAELGVDDDGQAVGVTDLRHVRPYEERHAAEEIANRTRCEDFKVFRPLFEKVQQELDAGLRETREFKLKSEIAPGRFFIVGGQKAYVAEMGEEFLTAHSRTDARLRVIFDNGTESNLLKRSLQRALHKDPAGRRITESGAGPLFGDGMVANGEASGFIYVLRSKSDHPTVTKHRELVHKIGVTTSNVERRIARARLDPTFLMADVEIAATYKLYNINRNKLENLIHRIFEPARLEIEIRDRFDNPVVPREWFLVPLAAVDEAVERIKNGTIVNFVYDPRQARFVPRDKG